AGDPAAQGDHRALRRPHRIQHGELRLLRDLRRLQVRPDPRTARQTAGPARDPPARFDLPRRQLRVHVPRQAPQGERHPVTITPLDDYPLHQTPLPIAQMATGDPNHYDRYWFNG